MPTRKAHAVWKGTLKAGSGEMAVESGAFKGAYSFGTRFGEEKGTNPEELIGAAHAGCFSMALSGVLEAAGHPPTRIETEAAVSVEKQGDGFSITTVRLTTKGQVPGIDAERFKALAEQAKNGCPVSRALTGVSISLEAELLD
ncbi:MAG: OsmC family protein [Pseudomonadota bacterium]